MSGFEADWLGAREPADRAARSAGLAERFAARLGASSRLLDLGSGTGSNIRYLVQCFPGTHHWLALDHDPQLLEAMAQAFAGFAAGAGLTLSQDADGLVLDGAGGRHRISPRLGDLADLDALPDLADVDGITASALLDLTSAAWLDRLAAKLAARSLPALFALSFDGRMSFLPERPDDAEVRARFVEHQRGDKGFGPALGPEAVTYLAAALERRGREVVLASSDWQLGPGCPGLTAMFLDGIRTVLDETPGRALDDWRIERRAQLGRGHLHVLVGHQDLLVL